WTLLTVCPLGVRSTQRHHLAPVAALQPQRLPGDVRTLSPLARGPGSIAAAPSLPTCAAGRPGSPTGGPPRRYRQAAQSEARPFQSPLVLPASPGQDRAQQLALAVDRPPLSRDPHRLPIASSSVGRRESSAVGVGQQPAHAAGTARARGGLPGPPH